jgi:hypothetical protein
MQFFSSQKRVLGSAAPGFGADTSSQVVMPSMLFVADRTTPKITSSSLTECDRLVTSQLSTL